VQVLPGDPAPAVVEGVVVVLDLLPLAIAGLRARESDADSEAESEAGGESPSGASQPARGLVAADVAVWPLVAGLGALVGVEVLAPLLVAAGVRGLQGARLELSGRERRDLGEELPEERYLALFHGAAPEPASLARLALRHGLAPLLARPLPRPPLRGAANLRAAGALAAAGELCLWLGEPESRAQSLLHAGRFAERSPHDLAALARDGNLAVLPWLEGESRDVAATAAAGREPELLRMLRTRLGAL
jgi:hypothetical protein